MIIYAVFMCFHVTNSCVYEVPFKTLAECDDYARRWAGAATKSADGRYPVDAVVWYECRGKRVETWEPAR